MTRYNKNFDKTYPFTDTGIMMQLIANTALNTIVPGGVKQYYRANFTINSTVDVWVRINGTAILPTSGVQTNTYNQEKINSFEFVKYVSGTDELSFISNSTAQVGVALLELPSKNQ